MNEHYDQIDGFIDNLKIKTRLFGYDKVSVLESLEEISRLYQGKISEMDRTFQVQLKSLLDELQKGKREIADLEKSGKEKIEKIEALQRKLLDMSGRRGSNKPFRESGSVRDFEEEKVRLSEMVLNIRREESRIMRKAEEKAQEFIKTSRDDAERSLREVRELIRKEEVRLKAVRKETLGAKQEWKNALVSAESEAERLTGIIKSMREDCENLDTSGPRHCREDVMLYEPKHCREDLRQESVLDDFDFDEEFHLLESL